jgi:tetratricopeptide (TPR) repeat protein
MAKRKLSILDILQEFSVIPEAIWVEVREALEKQMPRAVRRARRPDPSRWATILDDERRVIELPEDLGLAEMESTEDTQILCNHVARAELMLDIVLTEGHPSPSDGLYDVELAFLGALAWAAEDDDYAKRVLYRFGQRGIDFCVAYEDLLDNGAELAAEKDGEADFRACTDRLIEAATSSQPELAASATRAWADYLVYAGRGAEGEAIYDELIREDPTCIENYVSLSSALGQTGQPEKATELLKKAFALSLELNDEHSAETIGNALAELGAISEDELDEALETVAIGAESDEELFDQALEDHPDFAPYIDGEKPLVNDAMPDGTNPLAHIMIHVAVEKQIEKGETPEVNEALLRLTASGLTRHDAIHKLSEPLATIMFAAFDAGKEPDPDAYIRAVKKLGR